MESKLNTSSDQPTNAITAKAREVKPQWGDLELLPGFKDPMTMQRCNDPAISPQGYVMGYSTWMRVLNKTFDYDNIDGNVPQLARNTCPFTKQKVSP